MHSLPGPLHASGPRPRPLGAKLPARARKWCRLPHTEHPSESFRLLTARVWLLLLTVATYLLMHNNASQSKDLSACGKENRRHTLRCESDQTGHFRDPLSMEPVKVQLFCKDPRALPPETNQLRQASGQVQRKMPYSPESMGPWRALLRILRVTCQGKAGLTAIPR